MSCDKKVNKEEFDKFRKEYPNPLETDMFMGMPTWNDFTLGNWPESIVAKITNFEHNYPDTAKYDYWILNKH